jgi:hypothetical protein
MEPVVTVAENDALLLENCAIHATTVTARPER